MHILISGGGGLIGKALVPRLEKEGHTVVRLVRTKKGNDLVSILWNPDAGVIDNASLENFEAVIHLAGENIAGKRWNRRQKERIRNSRINSTELLSHTLTRLNNPPRIFICASAVGFYGDRGDEILDETSSPGQGFLAEVCRDWEKATEPAVHKGIRTVNLRTGVVLSRVGGAFNKMLTPLKLGIGGRLGNGRQYISWIMLEDLLGAVIHILNHDSIIGPVNIVAPHPVSNAEFTQKIVRLLHRPALFPVPAFLLHLVAGEMAAPLLLASAHVLPKRLLETGFNFKYPTLETALSELLTK